MIKIILVVFISSIVMFFYRIILIETDTIDLKHALYKLARIKAMNKYKVTKIGTMIGGTYYMPDKFVLTFKEKKKVKIYNKNLKKFEDLLTSTDLLDYYHYDEHTFEDEHACIVVIRNLNKEKFEKSDYRLIIKEETKGSKLC